MTIRYIALLFGMMVLSGSVQGSDAVRVSGQSAAHQLINSADDILEDSSSSELEKCKARVNKGLALMELEKPVQARQLFEEVLQNSTATLEVKSEASYQLGIVFFEQSSPGLAREALTDALQGFEESGHSFKAAKTHIILGKIYQSSFKYEATDSHWQQALEYFQTERNLIMEAETLTLIGRNFQHMDEAFEAEKSFKAALTIYQNLGLSDAVNSTALTLYDMYVDQYRYDDALSLVRGQHDQCVDSGDQRKSIVYLEKEAAIHALKRDYNRAVSIQEQAVASAQLHHPQISNEVKLTLGSYLVSSDRNDEAVPLLENVLFSAEEVNQYSLMRASAKLLSGLFLESGELQLAYDYLSTADSVNWLMASAKMEELQQQIESLRQEQDDAFLQPAIVSNTNWLESELTYVAAGILMFMVVLALTILIVHLRFRAKQRKRTWSNYKRIRELRKMNKDLLRKNVDLNTKSREELRVIIDQLRELRTQRYSKRSAEILNEIQDTVFALAKVHQLRISPESSSSKTAKTEKLEGKEQDIPSPSAPEKPKSSGTRELS